jgi:hypothetical protein
MVVYLRPVAGQGAVAGGTLQPEDVRRQCQRRAEQFHQRISDTWHKRLVWHKQSVWYERVRAQFWILKSIYDEHTVYNYTLVWAKLPAGTKNKPARRRVFELYDEAGPTR